MTKINKLNGSQTFLSLGLPSPDDTGDDQDAREADTILAALRYWQSAITEGRARFATAEMEIATEHGPALDTAEIDALCERLNTGGN